MEGINSHCGVLLPGWAISASNSGYSDTHSDIRLKYSLMLRQKVGSRQLVYSPFLNTVKFDISHSKASLF